MDFLSDAISRIKVPPVMGNVVGESDNGYDFIVGDRDEPYTGVATNYFNRPMNAQQPFNSGDFVNAVHIQGNVNLPVLIAHTSGFAATTPGTPQAPNTGPTNIPISAGMWVQTGGFWWSEYSGVFACDPLPIPLGTITETETFKTGLTPVNITVNPGGTSATGITVSLKNLPSLGFYQNFTLTNLFLTTAAGTVDYVDYFITDKNNSSPIFPFSLVSVIENDDTNMYTATQAGSTTNLNQLPNITITNVPDNDYEDDPEGPDFHLSDITQIKIIYTYQVVSVNIQMGSSGSGPDTAISPRGLVMFPNTSTEGNADQIFSNLMANYVPLGGETQVATQQDTLTYATGAVGITLSYAPITINNWNINDFDRVDGLDGDGVYAYTLYNQGTTLYCLATAHQNNFANGEIDITYQYLSDNTQTYTDNFVADGVSNTVTLTQPINPSTTIIPPVLDPDEDDLYSFDVTTNIVTLSVIPDAGDNISITYTQNISVSQTDTFTFGTNMTDGQTSFQLSQQPIAGTISVPANPGNGFNFINAQQGNQNSITLYPLLSGANNQTVMFAMTHTGGDNGNSYINYTYNKSLGSLFNITSFYVNERDTQRNLDQVLQLPYTGQAFSATPTSNFTGFFSQSYTGILNSYPPLPGQVGIHWQTGWQYQRWGFLNYDALTDSYNAITPFGIYWRARTTTNVLNTDYTFTPWPDEMVSADPLFVGWNYPDDPSGNFAWTAGTVTSRVTPGMKRRGAPFMGVSCENKYALVGSYGACGQGTLAQKITLAPVGSVSNYTGGQGAPSDSDYPLHFFYRDPATFVWTNTFDLSPLDMPQEVNGSGLLYVPGCGLHYLEAVGGYATGRADGTNGRKNSWWPAAKDMSAWFIGCGWCQSQWLKDVSGLNNGDNYQNFPIGDEDAGFTLGAYDPATADLLDSITWKCDPTDIQFAYAENQLDLANAARLSNDQLAILSPQFFISGPIMEGTSGYGCYAPFDTIGYTLWNFYMGSYGAPIKPLLKSPGIPALADGYPRYSNMNYGILGSQDNFASQRIAGDGEDNLYFCLSIPYWARTMNSIGPSGGAKLFSGTNTYNVVYSNENGYASSTPYCYYVGLGGQSYPTGAGGIQGNAGAVGLGVDVRGYTPTGSMFGSPSISSAAGCTVNGNHYAIEWQSGYTTFDLITFNNQVIEIPGDATIEGTVKINWTCYYPDPETNTLSAFFPASNFVLNPQYPEQTLTPGTYATYTCTVGSATATYHSYFEENGATYLDDYGPHPNGVGGGSSGMALNGFLTFTFVGANFMNFVQNARTLLIKVSYDNVAKKLEEVWRLDISTLENIDNIPNPVTWAYGTFTGSAPAANIPNFRRVLFTRPVGRYIFILREGSNTVQGPHVEIFLNGDTAPTTFLYRIPLLGLTSPTDWDMYQGVDNNNCEWAAFEATDGIGGQAERWMIRCNADQTVGPLYFSSTTIDGSFPSIFNLQGMASSANKYFFTDENYSIYERPGSL